MPEFIIEGGKRLRGSIPVFQAKNSAVAILCASLMVDGEITLEDVPRIQEVDRILEILKSIGVTVDWQNDHTLNLDTSSTLKLEAIDRASCQRVRSSLLLLGALAARVPEYKLYKAGGCTLGERTVRPHIFALKKLGVKIESKSKYYQVRTETLVGTRVVMYESGDTPTENVIMAAVLASGITTIAFASANYMVQDLCYFLLAAGADITGIGTTTLTIRGVKSLKRAVLYAIMPDPIEAMTFIALAVTTSSRLTIENCPIDFLELELEKLSVMGQKFMLINERKSRNGFFRIVDIRLDSSVIKALPDKLYGRSYPGLNIDNVPMFVPIFTQAKGRSMIHDWIYENRAIYYLELQKLGAKVVLLDPHRLFVEGKTELRGNELVCPPAIRPAMAILIAMLTARGRSVLRSAYPIERAHERLSERLQAVGADITYQADN